MEILYVTAMVAIFALCLTLLFTARRILRSSPLSSGELALSGMYDVPMPVEDLAASDTEAPEENLYDSARARLDFVMARAAQPERIGTEPVMATWVSRPSTTVRMHEPATTTMYDFESPVAVEVDQETVLNSIDEAEPILMETAMTETPMTETLVEQAVWETPASASTQVAAPLAQAAPRAEKTAERNPRKAVKERKASSGRHNYTLDCLLLGVSVLALIATQRGMRRDRSQGTSHHRVA